MTVQVLGTQHKITAAAASLRADPDGARERAGETYHPEGRCVRGRRTVTNIETVTFDSASGNMDERKKWVPRCCKDRQYDKKTPYRLVLRDADTGIEQQSVDVTIDRAFTDDF